MKRKKLFGAIASGGVVLLYYGMFFTFFLLLDEWTIKDFPFLTCLFLIFGIPLIGIFVSLIMRIKEIENGEEEEAKKY